MSGWWAHDATRRDEGGWDACAGGHACGVTQHLLSPAQRESEASHLQPDAVEGGEGDGFDGRVARVEGDGCQDAVGGHGQVQVLPNLRAERRTCMATRRLNATFFFQ